MTMGKCLYCLRSMHWEKGMHPCCQDCEPKREKDVKEIKAFVSKRKAKESGKAAV